MRNVSLQRVGRNDDHRNARPETVLVERWRRDVVVESTEVVPGEEDGGRIPVGTTHDGINLIDCPILTLAAAPAGMIVVATSGHQPAYGRQFSILSVADELSGTIHHVLRPER